mgnify:CR=1 FL=1
MLKWQKGNHPQDGIWWKHWYDWFYDEWDTSGADEAVEDSFNDFLDKGLKVFGIFTQIYKSHSISISNLILIKADSLKFSLNSDILFAYLLSRGEILS